MKKLLTLILVLASLASFSQTTYQLNYDSIRVGKTAGTGGTSLYGKVYFKNVGLGLVSDSILTVLNGKIRKIPVSGVYPTFGAFGSTPNANGGSISGSVITLQPASASFPGGVTTGTQAFTGFKTFGGTMLIGNPTPIANAGVGSLAPLEVAKSGDSGGIALSTDYNVAYGETYIAGFAPSSNSTSRKSAVIEFRKASMAPLNETYSINLKATQVVAGTGFDRYGMIYWGGGGMSIFPASAVDTTLNPGLKIMKVNGAIAQTKMDAGVAGTDSVEVRDATTRQTKRISPTYYAATTGNVATATALQTARSIGGVSFDGTASITVASASSGFTVSGGNLAVGSNDITMTGSLGTTVNRLTKGWFTDLQVTNPIAGSITGNAATVTTNANLTGDVTSIGNTTTYNGIVPIVKGGTGSATQNFVDLTTPQTIGGIKAFTSSPVISGGNALQIESGVTGFYSFLQAPAGMTSSKTITLPDFTSTLYGTGASSITSAQLATSLTDETGTGASVFASSPTLITPNLGTPNTLIGTNITGTASGLTAGTVTTNANLTGVVTSVGNATSIADAALSIAKTSGLQTALDLKLPKTAGISEKVTGILYVERNAQAMDKAPVTGTNTTYDYWHNTSGDLVVGLNSSTGTGLFASGGVAYAPAIYTNNNLPVQIGTNGIPRLNVNGDGSLGITTAPTTSAGTYDILTRNTSTGDVEKLTSIAPTAWTPASASPALSSASGTYTKNGYAITVNFTITFPVSASTSQVVITGFPHAAYNYTGIAFSYNDSGLAILGETTTTGFKLSNNSGANITYQDMSGKIIRGSTTYITTVP